MAGFKIGDRVRIQERFWINYPDDLGIQTISGQHKGKYWEFAGLPHTKRSGWTDDELELVTTNEINGDKPMARRTFRQLKDTATLRKGALWQEKCEDGTQPYACINASDVCKSTIDGSPGEYRDRALVEGQPDWFVEVFKVEPEYMTQEELDRYKAFLGQKKLGRPKGSKTKTIRKRAAKK